MPSAPAIRKLRDVLSARFNLDGIYQCLHKINEYIKYYLGSKCHYVGS